MYQDLSIVSSALLSCHTSPVTFPAAFLDVVATESSLELRGFCSFVLGSRIGGRDYLKVGVERVGCLFDLMEKGM